MKICLLRREGREEILADIFRYEIKNLFAQGP